jgi:AcrR family transcriptional regulator
VASLRRGQAARPSDPPPEVSESVAPILAAAIAIIRDEGAGALRVRRIAELSGRSTKGVYTHFGGKNGLVDAICIDGFTRMRQHIVERIRTDTGLARLRSAGAAYRSWALANPTQYQVMFARAVPEYEYSDHTRAVGAEAFDVLVAATAAASSLGEIRIDDPYKAAAWLWAAIHGHVMLELAQLMPLAVPFDWTDLFEGMVERLLAGLRPHE